MNHIKQWCKPQAELEKVLNFSLVCVLSCMGIAAKLKSIATGQSLGILQVCGARVSRGTRSKAIEILGQNGEKHLQNYLNTSGVETFLRPVNDIAFAREAEWYGQGCSPRLQLSMETVA